MNALLIRLHASVRDYIALDLRALALMRISLATLILADLAIRAQYLTAHYGDYGVFPRSIWETTRLPYGYWSLHLIFGSPYWTLFLMVVAAICALCLLVGFKTRLATILVWVFTVSLTHANPLILQGGDALLRIILFLAIFLPLGARFSLDARGCTASQSRVASLWTFAYLTQIGLVYFFAAILKNGAAWQDGSAVYYALSVDGFDAIRTALGDFIYTYPEFMRLCTYAVHAMQWAAIPLLFLPVVTQTARSIAVILLMLMHLAFASTMHLGMFSWIAITALIPLCPPILIDALMRTVARLGFGRATIYYDGTCGFCRLTSHLLRILLLLPQTAALPAQDYPAYYAVMQREHSWVIIDRNGKAHLSYRAFIVLLRASPIFFIFAPILALRPFVWAGTRAYHIIATHRPRIPFSAAPYKRSLGKTITLYGRLAIGSLALLYIATAILTNLVSTNRISETAALYAPIKKPLIMLGLEQHWSMFAPNPAIASGWIIAIGQYVDGTERSLLPQPHALSYDTEEDPGAGLRFLDARERKYAFNLAVSGTAAPYAREFGRYLCMREVRNTDRYGALEEIRIVFMRRFTLPEGQSSPMPMLLLKHQCPT